MFYVKMDTSEGRGVLHIFRWEKTTLFIDAAYFCRVLYIFGCLVILIQTVHENDDGQSNKDKLKLMSQSERISPSPISNVMGGALKAI